MNYEKRFNLNTKTTYQKTVYNKREHQTKMIILKLQRITSFTVDFYMHELF